MRRYLEPGPIVLVSSRWKKQVNIMTLGWQTMMEFSPSLVGCTIAGGNFSFDLIRNSRECVINIPSAKLVDKVVGIGNCSGSEIDKFQEFQLTPVKASKVKAPMIQECFASLECKLADDSLIDKYNFFIFEVVKAHLAPTPKHPQTLHYAGNGEFMVSGKRISRRAGFRPEYL
ncbi:flavin reductase family protein [Collimonas arenae]|nr:flavin reductase family protein [Collimonas arenae]